MATAPDDAKNEVSDDSDLHTDRLDRYARGHARAIAQAEWIYTHHERDDSAMATRLLGCGTWLEFREYYTLGEIKCTAARFCDLAKLCPLCAARRAGRTIRRYADRLEQVSQTNATSRAFLVTLTMKNDEDLVSVLDRLKDALAAMRKRRTHGRNGKVNTIFAQFEGVLGGIEVKRGKGSGAWHPHAHMLVLANTNLATQGNERRISQEWLELTGDSFIIDVRPIKDHDDPVNALLEVVKYPLKFGENDLADAYHFHQNTKGRRFLFALGTLYGVKVDLLDDSPEDLPYIQRCYAFNWEGPDPRYEVREITRKLPPKPDRT